jgi:hypothetical protein
MSDDSSSEPPPTSLPAPSSSEPPPTSLPAPSLRPPLSSSDDLREIVTRLGSSDESAEVLQKEIETALVPHEENLRQLKKQIESARQSAVTEERKFDEIVERSPGGVELKKSRKDLKHARETERLLIESTYRESAQIRQFKHRLEVLRLKHEANSERAREKAAGEREAARTKAEADKDADRRKAEADRLRAMVAALSILATAIAGLAKTGLLPSFLTHQTTPPVPTAALSASARPVIPPCPTPPPAPTPAPCPKVFQQYQCSYSSASNELALDTAARRSVCRNHTGNGVITVKAAGDSFKCQCP